MTNFISTDLLSNFIDGIVLYLPRVFGAFVLIILGKYIAKKVGKLLKKLLVKTGVDKYGETLKDLSFIDNLGIDLKISGIFSAFVSFFIFLFFLVTAVEVLSLDAISNLVLDFISYLPSLFSAVVILIVGTLFALFIKKAVHSACSSIGIPAAGVIANIVFYILFISIAMSALEQAQFETKVISNNLTLVMGGIVMAFAIGYGLASKQMVSNQLNSLYYKSEFSTGQRIKIGDTEGVIIDMNSNNVILENGDKRIIIPFKRFSEENIIIYKD